MHTNQTKAKFLELRSQGWSIASISTRMKVSRPTLIKWAREFRGELHCLRAIEIEALHKKIVSAQQQDIANLSTRHSNLERELAKRSLADVPTDKLFHLDALLRKQLQETRSNTFTLQEKIHRIPNPEPSPFRQMLQSALLENFKRHAGIAQTPEVKPASSENCKETDNKG